MDNIVKSYLEAALWSSLDGFGISLDKNFKPTDFTEESLALARMELCRFMLRAGSLTEGTQLTKVAYDFWLSRNRHSIGFWDGDYPSDAGRQLTKIAHTFCAVICFTYDGKVYFEYPG